MYKFKKFIKLYNQITEQILTAFDKGGYQGGINEVHSDAGSITGNQCNFMNNEPATDIGSITGNNQEHTDIGSETGNQIKWVNMTNQNKIKKNKKENKDVIDQQQGAVVAQPGISSSDMGNSSSNNSTPGVTTNDIKNIYVCTMPKFKCNGTQGKSKSKKIKRNYPLFHR